MRWGLAVMLGGVGLLAGCHGEPDFTRQQPPGPKAYVLDTVGVFDGGNVDVFRVQQIDGTKLDRPPRSSLLVARTYFPSMFTYAYRYRLKLRPVTLRISGERLYRISYRSMAHAYIDVSGAVRFTPEDGHWYEVKGGLSRTRATLYVMDMMKQRVVGGMLQFNDPALCARC